MHGEKALVVQSKMASTRMLPDVLYCGAHGRAVSVFEAG